MASRFFRRIGGFLYEGSDTILAIEVAPGSYYGRVIKFSGRTRTTDLSISTLLDRAMLKSYEEFIPLGLLRKRIEDSRGKES